MKNGRVEKAHAMMTKATDSGDECGGSAKYSTVGNVSRLYSGKPWVETKPCSTGGIQARFGKSRPGGFVSRRLRWKI